MNLPSGRLCLAILSALALAACARGVGLTPSASTSSPGGSAADSSPSFAQFSDIPIPSGAKMNLDRTLILGPQDSWIGRLGLETSHNTTTMYDFYKQKTPEFGWQEITSVRSAISVLTYTRAERVLTITLRTKTISGSELDITMSPRGGGKPMSPASSASPQGLPPPPAR